MEQYRTAAAQHAALEQRAQWVGALAATAGGTLTSKQKIKLEAYIQMDYLDRILRHANLRLMQMTDAQYELERIGAENQRSQSGLDLGVIDHYNGTRRSVKTLSGGESFKASLALALGLSDEVQSAAGGIRLDTLFLDEGFGSLDEESLEQAIRVLASLTEGDRLVGIISHVGALKDRIDRQVVVHKNRTGSQLQPVQPAAGQTAGPDPAARRPLGTRHPAAPAGSARQSSAPGTGQRSAGRCAHDRRHPRRLPPEKRAGISGREGARCDGAICPGAVQHPAAHLQRPPGPGGGPGSGGAAGRMA